MDVEWLKGEICTAVWEPVPGGGVFAFQFGTAGVVITCPWRLVEGGAILVARGNHGQPARGRNPVDAAQKAFALLAGRPISGGRINALVGDFVLEFEGGMQLEVFNESSSNEAWKMAGPNGPSLVASSSGEVVSKG